MTHYRKSLVIAAPPATVYEALTTRQGIRSWWTATCDGVFAPGGEIDFHFGRHHKRARVEVMQPWQEVRWLCTHSRLFVGSDVAHEEWTGTRMIFRLAPLDGGRTRLDFEHVGLTPALLCFEQCNDGWDYSLASLGRYAETGRGTPWVNESKEAAA